LLHCLRAVFGIAAMTLLAASPSARAGPVAEQTIEGYADVLRDHTKAVNELPGTVVDYAALKREPRWQAVVKSLESAKPDALTSPDAKLAFWINAYNVLAIQTVVRSYPLRSIRDVGSVFSPVWKREAGKIDGKSVTLDQIEHQILRPMGDPRVHAAIVCASRSCPSLRREPYTAAGVSAQLDDSMRRFLADRRKGLDLDTKTGRLRLSSIFKWFDEDFDAKGGVVKFVARYAPTEVRTWLGGHPNPKLEYFSYDWNLNGSEAPR
jgi:hypothetical protein